MTESEKYMTEALAEAEKALAAGEVPIGAVMVRNGEIIARGHNLRNTDKNPLRHAEIDVIDAAAKIVGDWRLEDCALCYRRALPHVRGGNRAGAHPKGDFRDKKQQGRLRRLCAGCAE